MWIRQISNNATLRADTTRFCVSLCLAHIIDIGLFLFNGKIGPQFQIRRPPSIEWSFL